MCVYVCVCVCVFVCVCMRAEGDAARVETAAMWCVDVWGGASSAEWSASVSVEGSVEGSVE